MSAVEDKDKKERDHHELSRVEVSKQRAVAHEHRKDLRRQQLTRAPIPSVLPSPRNKVENDEVPERLLQQTLRKDVPKLALVSDHHLMNRERCSARGETMLLEMQDSMRGRREAKENRMSSWKEDQHVQTASSRAEKEKKWAADDQRVHDLQWRKKHPLRAQAIDRLPEEWQQLK